MNSDNNNISCIKYLSLSISLLLLMGIFFLTSCQRESSTAETVKIGVIADDLLDGTYQSLNGVELALEKIEEKGGLVIAGREINIELVKEKITFSPEQAVSSIRKLINSDNVVAVIGPQYSADAISAAEIAEKSRIPMISPMSTHPETTAGHKYIFRMSYKDDVQGRAMAVMALNELQATRAAILYNEADPYSKGLAKVFHREFSRRGLVAAMEKYVAGDTDFLAQLRKIGDAEADVLYLPGFIEELLVVVENIKESGLAIQLLGSDGWNQVKAPKIRGLEGAFYSTHWADLLPYSDTSAFVADYRKRFKDNPISTAALSYDALNIIVESIKLKNGISPDEIRDGIIELEPMPGVGGIIDFHDTGDPDKNVLVLQILNGRNQLFKIIHPHQVAGT